MFKRKKRPISAQVVVLTAAAMFILVAIIIPAARVLMRQEAAPPPVAFSLEEAQTVNVFANGEIVPMPLEEYLIGVVAAEMPASYEIEALKAQAVAARTYTLYKQHNGGCNAHNGADVCAESAHCQAYRSREQLLQQWGDDFSANMLKIETAVASTAGEVLYYGGEEIQVFFHASSGGMTENCENVYSQALPYLVSVPSAGEEASSHFYGEVSVSREQFAAAMKRYSPSITLDADGSGAGIGRIVRFDSGRVESIEIGDETFTGREIRGIFELNSANFTIDVDERVTFSTIGFGHGVGMSQTGANAMAKDGATYDEILTHYYTGVTIE